MLHIDTPATTTFTSFSLLPKSDRLVQAKSLALSINVICDRFDVIQLKDKSVISLCNEALSRRVIDMLPDHQVNLLYQNSSEYEDLVDAMIHEDRDIIILLENGLLDERRLSHLDCQLHTIKSMRDANIKIINISTAAIALNLDTTLMNVYDTITGSIISEPVSYTHLTLPTICSV